MSDGRWQVTGSPVREDRPKNWVEDDDREFLIQCFRRPARYAEVVLDEEMPPVIARLLNEAEASTPSPPAPQRKPEGDRLACQEPLFFARVGGAGGGIVNMTVARETQQYPHVGIEVAVYPADLALVSRADLVVALSEAEVWERAARKAVEAHVAPEQVEVVLEVLYEQAAGDALDAEGERRFP